MKPPKPAGTDRETEGRAAPSAAATSNPVLSRPLSRRALGDAGEARAAAHLEAQGWRILARNVRAGGVELDLIAERRGLLAIIEVKTRRNRFAGAPEEAVDARKRARLVRGAAAWLHDNPQRRRSVRFDVIVCEWEPATQEWSVRHLAAAFDASD
jgi:putative endonuclease